MISRCTQADETEILDFIADDYCRCLYLYLDMVRYGFDTPFVSMWRQNGADGSLAAVWLRYHSGMHVYAPHGYANIGEAAAFVEVVLRFFDVAEAGAINFIGDIERIQSRFRVDFEDMLIGSEKFFIEDRINMELDDIPGR